MALLDFIKNRDGQRPAAEQQSQQQNPETYKQMKTREAAEEKATAKPITHIPPEHQVKVDAVKADMAKATQHQSGNLENAPAVPTDATASPQPMVQPMMNQDKAAPALSPTSAQAGQRSTEKDAAGASDRSPAKAQEQSQERSQTLARTRPSWER